MLSKRARPYDAESLGKRARLMRNAEDIFASGQISADRLTEVCKDINRIDPIIHSMRAIAGNALAHPRRSGTYQYRYTCTPVEEYSSSRGV